MNTRKKVDPQAKVVKARLRSLIKRRKAADPQTRAARLARYPIPPPPEEGLAAMKGPTAADLAELDDEELHRLGVSVEQESARRREPEAEHTEEDSTPSPIGLEDDDLYLNMEEALRNLVMHNLAVDEGVGRSHRSVELQDAIETLAMRSTLGDGVVWATLSKYRAPDGWHVLDDGIGPNDATGSYGTNC